MSGNVNGWYASLASQGLFLSDVILNERLPEGPSSVDPAQFNEVKSALLAFRTAVQGEESEASTEDVLALMEALFVDVLGHKANEFQAANSDGKNISAKFKASMPGKSLVPDFVLRRHGNTNRGRLLAKTLPPSVKLRGASRAGKVQRELILLLRHCRLEFGLLTNGHSLRLLRVTPEDVSWIQWDTATWEESEQGRSQFDAFYTLLGRDEVGQQPLDTSKAESTDGPDRYVLQDACSQSRQRQSSLSSVVGEGVRQSVELLVNRLNEAAISSPELLEDILGDALPRSDEERSALSSLHQAAVRLVMRMIVIMFAEARDLLPHRSSQVYRNNYSLTRLLEQLEDTESSLGQEALTTSLQAWPRILGLFDLVHDGSHHESLSIHAYGGELFRPGVGDSDDAVLRSLHAFEHEKATLDDARVLSILRKLKRSKMKANINGKSTWVATTVDYTTMDTEFIGMVYEGLLDYELRRVHEDDGAMVTLRIGQQPMLPISLLESQDDAQLKSLIKTLDKKKDAGAPDLEEETKASDDSSEEDEPTEDEVAENTHDIARERAEVWALRAVKASGKVKKPKGKKAQFVDMKELEIEAARNLLLSIHAPGDMYLVNYSGNRKGSGTFYTPPGLSIPTVRRTLEPLCYDIVEEESEEGLVRTLTPKTPEHILAQTVCDPAMGSGSFLVAALRYLTDALFTSLEYHGNFAQMKKGTRITLPAGTVSKAAATEDLALHPDDARFEVECKARLKRYVAQRCIYGVDLNPMAVELGKMSLWVETLSRDLPFEFLDHHIKCGNSLVGAWFDEFEHFPLAAFARDTGDSGSTRSKLLHHEPNCWRDLMNDHLKRLKDPKSPISVISMIKGAGGQRSLFNFNQEDPFERRRRVLAERRSGFEGLQNLPLHDPILRENYYNDLQENQEFIELKLMMDSWCACWFWPPDQLDYAPIPSRFNELVSGKSKSIVQKIANKQNFFHWELEFPDIFHPENFGFSAVIGNPPWEEIAKKEIEYFSKFDTIFRTHGPKHSKEKIKQLFESSKSIEDGYVSYSDSHASLSNFFRNRYDPFGQEKIKLKTKDSQQIHNSWAAQRGGNNNPGIFCSQGSSMLNTYKLFLEIGFAITSAEGRLGMVVPGGIYSDAEANQLRERFCTDSSIDWLFMFVNYEKIFQIPNKQKFGPIIVQKGSSDVETKASFLNISLASWDTNSPEVLAYNNNLRRKLSPLTGSYIELKHEAEVELLRKMILSSVNLGSEIWGFKYERDYDMKNDAHKFVHSSEIFQNATKDPLIEAYWIGDQAYLPLYQGIMFNVFEYCRAAYVSGSGHSAYWNTDLKPQQTIVPQYFISLNEVKNTASNGINSRIFMRTLGDSLSWRSSISIFNPYGVAGHSVGCISNSHDLLTNLGINAVLSSFVYDFHWRLRLGGMNQSWAFKKETLIPPPSNKLLKIIGLMSLSLIGINRNFSKIYVELRNHIQGTPQSMFCITKYNRDLVQSCIELIVAKMYGLDHDDLAFILRETNYPAESFRDRDFKLGLNQKGFWKVDLEKKPSERLTQKVLELSDMVGSDLKELTSEELNEYFLGKAGVIAKQRKPETIPKELDLSWEDWEKIGNRIESLLR